jgi:hypothetical protein
MYKRIFTRYAAGVGQSVPEGLVAELLQRYVREGRELRASEASALIDRAQDICRLQERPLTLDSATLDVAWRGYFSQS